MRIVLCLYIALAFGAVGLGVGIFFMGLFVGSGELPCYI